MLTQEGQRKVDELRDRFTSRRDALESANSSIQDSCQRSSNRLRTLNRAKRKDWKILFDGIVFERKRLVRTSLSLHGVKSCAVSKGSVASAGEMFEIGGRSAPPLFMHRGKLPDSSSRKDTTDVLECPTEQFNHVTSLVAQCGLLLSNYLGVKLPYGVILASSTNTKIGLLAGTSDQTMTLSLHENVSDSAGALARLIVDISHLCHVQGLRSHTDESNLVKMLFEMNASDYIGQYDDDTAFSTSRAKGKLNRERQEQSWDVQSLVDKVSHGLINEPFELIEHNSNHSSVYSIRDLHL